MRYLVVVFIFILSFKSFSQKKSILSNDTVQFLSDLNLYFIDNTGSRMETENYLREFNSNWERNKIAGYYKEVIIRMSNLMASKKLKPNPFFLTFFSIVYNYQDSKHPIENFEDYLGLR
jgi:hypothetical protein